MVAITLPELQLERINAIAENDITALKKVWKNPPASIDEFLPCLVVLDEDWSPPERISSGENKDTYTWDLHFYLARLGDGLDLVNGINARSFLSVVQNAYVSRRLLQLNDNGLTWVTDSRLSLVSGLSKPKSYPPRQGTPNYWGSQYRLEVKVLNYVTQSA